MRTRPSGRPARASTLAGQCRARGGLEGHAVARQQRAGDLPERLREGRRAGADHADDAVGLEGHASALGQRHAAADAHAPPAQQVGAVVGDPDQRVDCRQQLQRRDLRRRASLLARQRRRELVEVVDHRLGHAAHVARSVLHAQQRPQRLHLGDLRDDLSDLHRRGGLHSAQRLTRGRVARLQRRGGRRLAGRRAHRND
jgi:hypothetical protein